MHEVRDEVTLDQPTSESLSFHHEWISYYYYYFSKYYETHALISDPVDGPILSISAW